MRKSTWLMALIVMPLISIGCSTLEAGNLPIRKESVAQVAEAHRYLPATVSTNVAVGNLTN